MLDLLFPLACPGCGAPGSAAAPLCPRCTVQLRPAPPAPPPPGIDAWWAPFAYQGVARDLVARVKYRNVRAVVPWIATAMVDAVGPVGRSADAITWAPTSGQRRRQRGFDPAEILARALARRLRIRCVGLLARGPGPAQTGLHGDARRRGPRFTSRRRAPGTVLVVDDIATTGATLAGAAAALRHADSRVVVAITAARTPPPRAP